MNKIEITGVRFYRKGEYLNAEAILSGRKVGQRLPIGGEPEESLLRSLRYALEMTCRYLEVHGVGRSLDDHYDFKHQFHEIDSIRPEFFVPVS